MNGGEKHELQCAEFEAMLAEAVERQLSNEAQRAFDGHRQTCSHCAPLYAEAEAGWQWLTVLKDEELEPPARLLANILCATSGSELPAPKARPFWWQRIRELPV
jgi:hypothetical protein